ncbi:hypothetical protein BHE74_00055719 [Ensete ventricosum]|nr:hypothetical protein BHE74_00055719 [Ensete ventricosum]
MVAIEGRRAAKLVSWLRLQSKRGVAARGRVAATKEGRSVGRKMAASQRGEEMAVTGGSDSGGEEGGYRDVAWCDRWALKSEGTEVAVSVVAFGASDDAEVVEDNSHNCGWQRGDATAWLRRGWYGWDDAATVVVEEEREMRHLTAAEAVTAERRRGRGGLGYGRGDCEEKGDGGRR